MVLLKVVVEFSPFEKCGINRAMALIQSIALITAFLITTVVADVRPL